MVLSHNHDVGQLARRELRPRLVWTHSAAEKAAAEKAAAEKAAAEKAAAEKAAEAQAAEQALHAAHPGWWVAAAPVERIGAFAG